MKTFYYATLILLTFAVPAFADITVSSPAFGAEVGSPFALSASAANCSAQNTAAMSYSLDSSPDTTVVTGTSVQAQVVSASGAHTLHIKAWGDAGSACVSDVAIAVVPTAFTPVIPSDAISVGSLQTLNNWVAQADIAVAGSSSGSTNLVNSPSLSGGARKFVSNYADYGDQRFDVSFGDDTTSTNFFYDAWVYLPSPSTSIANLEMDIR